MDDTYTIYEVVNTWDEPETSCGFYSSYERAESAMNRFVNEDYMHANISYEKAVKERQDKIDKLRASLNVPDTISDKYIADNGLYQREPHPPINNFSYRYMIREITVNED